MENWTWPTGAPADARRELPLFSVMPNWQSGVTETLAWLTDVMVSEQNVEQRRSVRRYPRRTFEGNFLRADVSRARLDNFFTGVGKRQCLMPIWHEQFSLLGTGRTDGVVVFPTGSLAKREFRLGDLVMCTNGDPAHSFILSVTVYDESTDSIKLQGVGASGTWPSGSRIIPLRVARNMEPGALNNVSQRVGQGAIRFTLSEPDTYFPADWNYCSPLWRIKPDRSGNVDTTYNRKDYVLDFDAGVVDVTEVSTRTAINSAMRFVFFGRDQVYDVRKFFYNARGRARRFYMPSFTEDLFPAQDISANTYTFDVQPSGFFDYMQAPQEARRIVSIEFADGRPAIYRNIVSVANIPNVSAPFDTRVERITCDDLMPPIAVDEIARISFIMPCRFDQDTIELFHHTDSLKGVSCALVVQSSVVDGMPPIECWTTSLPYSVLEIESVNANGFLTDGRMYAPGINAPTEALDAAGLMTDGTMRVALKSNSLVEMLDAAGAMTDGTLRTALQSTTAVPETLDASAIMTDGTLRAALISYISPSENIQSTAALTEGTLT